MWINVENIIDKETRESYRFTLFDLTFVFIGYRKEIKPAGKRKWQTVIFWDKYARHNAESVPELPENIKQKALIDAQKLIQVKTWEQYKTQ